MRKAIKNLRSRGNKKGFTLVELIVTIAVFSIVMGLALGMVMPLMESSASSNEYVFAKDLINATELQFRIKLSKEKYVVVSDNTDGKEGYDKSVYVQGGRLYTTEKGVSSLCLAESYYSKGVNLALTYEVGSIDGSICILKVVAKVTDKTTNQLYMSKDFYINFDNIRIGKGALQTEKITEEGTLKYIYFNKTA